MRVTEPGIRYEADGQRLLVTEYQCSLVLPPHYYGGFISGIRDIFSISSETLEGRATLYLSKAGTILVRGWLEESWGEGQSKVYHESSEPFAGTSLNRFVSNSYLGFKARVEDVFHNGIGLLAEGSLDREQEVSQLVKRLLGSIEFHDERPLNEQQLTEAVTAYLNASAQTGADVFLYIARHPYLARPEVIVVLQSVVKQMNTERHPLADHGADRLRLLEKAKEAIEAGVWAQAIGEIRDQL